MKITVIGCGYVGLVSGVCLASKGHKVTCVDSDQSKIRNLKKGKVPFYESQLQPLLLKALKKKQIDFSDCLLSSIQNSKVVIIALNTNSNGEHSVSLASLKKIVRTILSSSNKSTLIVIKSTLSLGQSRQLYQLINNKKGAGKSISLVYNPEFLSEGSAVKDFLFPQRIVLGTVNGKKNTTLAKIYSAFVEQDRILSCSFESAEVTKLASNAMLASRVAFINEVSRICDRTGASISFVSQAMGIDSRIGSKYLQPGPGFGGSCLPKDLAILSDVAKKLRLDTSLLSAVQKSNEQQMEFIVEKIVKTLGGSVRGKTITIWGLAFKENTSDVRSSSAQVIIKKILARGAKVNAYDDKALTDFQLQIGSLRGLTYHQDPRSSLKKSQCLVILTKDKDFLHPEARRAISDFTGSFFDCHGIYASSFKRQKGYYRLGENS